MFRDLKDVGGVKCITLTVAGDDMLLMDWVKVESTSQQTVTFYNKVKLSSDRSEGSSKLRLCV